MKPPTHFILSIILCLFSGFHPEVCAAIPVIPSFEPSLMKKAVPVWVSGREMEMNLTLGFRGAFTAQSKQTCTLRITASSLYRVYLNGEFLGYGPARASHGYFRIDEYDLGTKARKGENIIAVEVSGYNVNSFYTLDQPSFLQAEVQTGNQVVLATGTKAGFAVFQLMERIQKVERYSFQRAFTEYYRLSQDHDRWKASLQVPVDSLVQAIFKPVWQLPRNLPLPEFGRVPPVSIIARGTIQLRKPEKYKKDFSLTKISDKFKGYPENELEVIPSLTVQEILTSFHDTIRKPYPLKSAISLTANEFCTLDLGTNLSGFIGAKISCPQQSKIFLCFDEILSGGDVNSKKRMPNVNNLVGYELEPGDYSVESFETYTLRYLKIIVLKGSCIIQDVYLREYTYPENKKATFYCSNQKLNEIYQAARQTFRQCAVDVLMDNPSRERGAWLGDSYFTAIMEKDLTGYSSVARNHYENFLLPESFENVPEGMIPPCYPADHYDSLIIPNWAMWFVIQVNVFRKQGGDPTLIAGLKPRVEGILSYFSGFENKDGLLENLPGWIFVDWSKANDFVQNVNYPTNILYSAALANASEMYENEGWGVKSERIRQTVLKQSFNGTFFVDNAIRNRDGILERTANTSEACQYYAFFFNLATPGSHGALWNKLISDFGMKRNDSLLYPDVFRTREFVGNYFRLDILSRQGLFDQVLKEVQDYAWYANLTGTLWEQSDIPNAGQACNQGFASYLGHILYRDALGICQIDYIRKEITIRFSDIGLEECSGVLPVDESSIELKWKRSGNTIRYSLKIPPDYTVKVENTGSSTLVKL